MTVDRYTDGNNYVECEGMDWSFLEDWLEPYVEDIPVRKFQDGDKVVLKSGCKKTDGLEYLADFDSYVGRKITVDGYTDIGNVYFSDCPYIFEEEWLEPYEELKNGDLAIFWNLDKGCAIIGKYNGLLVHDVPFPHQDQNGFNWQNAVKFESKEQYEKLLKGEI